MKGSGRVMNHAIFADKLVKTYAKGFRAVDGVSLAIAPGEVFGFLGPNGAGKSTTVSMLTTRSVPSEGRALVGGYDVAKQPAQVRQIAGVALQEIGIDPLMKSSELLVLQCRLFGMPTQRAKQRAEALLDIVKLAEFVDRPVGTYSGGMRRRLDLALALAHEPDILFLDEPTTGLDPASRRDVWDEVRRLNRESGMTIFLTTQYLEEADVLAGRIAIINRGRIAAEGSPAVLKASLGSESITISFAEEVAAQRAQDILAPQAQRAQLDYQTLHLYLPDAARAVPRFTSALEQAAIQPIALTLAQPTLDDVFLQVTGLRFTANEANTGAAQASAA
jgi:ABC-2 type transport system ATP-binding protein